MTTSLRYSVVALAAVAGIIGITLAMLSISESIDKVQRILAFQVSYDRDLEKYVAETRYLRVSDLQPNKIAWFVDPFSSAIDQDSIESATPVQKFELLEKTEHFSRYILIRLPDWLGGLENDISSYRAYSAISPFDKCVMNYLSIWGRWAIENPCAGDQYRPWDGLAISGPPAAGVTSGQIPVRGYILGLATMPLTVDDEGYIAVSRPDRDPFANGIPGEGRRFSEETLERSNADMLRAAKLPFPVSVGQGVDLRILQPASIPFGLRYVGDELPFEAVYYDPFGTSQYITISAYPIKTFPDLALNTLTDNGYPFNTSAVNSVAGLPTADSPVVEKGTDIAGQYAVISFAEPEKEGVALVWGSMDGQDLLVVIEASNTEQKDLLSLARSVALQ